MYQNFDSSPGWSGGLARIPATEVCDRDWRKCYARVLIWDGAKVLVLKNIKRNRWEFPGGKQDAGEHITETATRETAEEIGVLVEDLKFVRVVDRYFEESGICHGHYFSTDKFANDPVIKEEDKFSEFRWVTIDELSDLVQIPRLCVDIARTVYEERL